MDDIANRRYAAPLRGADWTMSAVDLVAVHLSLALAEHVPGWPGATDEQLSAVARQIVDALDGSPVISTVKGLGQS